MDFIHRLQHAVQNYLGDRINLGNLGEDDLDAEFLALVAKCLGDIAAASNAAGVVDQYRRPGSLPCLEFTQHLLKSGTVRVLAGFDGIGKFSRDDEIPAFREIQEIVTLCLDRDRAAVLR
ncbi:MAG TPA: hypothetical protein PKL18_08540 [Accumulibacter sp.]|nr:hypothetical protein [Accumulibacter sp.]